MFPFSRLKKYCVCVGITGDTGANKKICTRITLIRRVLLCTYNVIYFSRFSFILLFFFSLSLFELKFNKIKIWGFVFNWNAIVISFEPEIYSQAVPWTDDGSVKRQNDEYKKSRSLSPFCCDIHYRGRGL